MGFLYICVCVYINTQNNNTNLTKYSFGKKLMEKNAILLVAILEIDEDCGGTTLTIV